jgi:hypothetical protein
VAEDFDTVWRQRFAPVLVDLPRSAYRDFIPRIDLIPVAVADDAVSELDSVLTAVFRQALDSIQARVAAVPPAKLRISLRQLIYQLPELLSHRDAPLKVFVGRRLVKSVPMNDGLRKDCAKLQMVMVERRLLFEDFPAEQGFYRSEGVGTGGSPAGRQASARHRFEPGKKVDAVHRILEATRPQRTVIFVRNVPVCEGLFAFLVRRGFAVARAHGEDEEGRHRALRAFKTGEARILIATRQLFGRGFDLPEADQAIFYSPKDSERTMWQEVLRIRSTVRNTKRCYVLFYAWTAEAAKMARLVERILATGGRPRRDTFRWQYEDSGAEPDEADSENGGAEPRDRYAGGGRDAASAGRPAGSTAGGQGSGRRRQATPPEAGPAASTDDRKAAAARQFVSFLLRSWEKLVKQDAGAIFAALKEAAVQYDFSQVWPPGIVDVLLRQLSASLPGARKSAKKTLAVLFHPDRHAEAGAKPFWHEMFVALEI